MLKITKEAVSGGTLVTIVGVIDENAGLDVHMGTISGDIIVQCAGIKRINSVGTRAWLRYFQRAQALGQKLRFVDCSIAVVEQSALFANFLCGGTVESLFLPYLCEDCGYEHDELCRVEDLNKNDLKPFDVACPKCGNQRMVLDHMGEDYLRILKR